MLAPLGLWMLYLRQAAWDHAEVLATQPGRARREEAMRKAMCAALEDVSDFRPWTAANLGPPDPILYEGGIPAAILALMTSIGLFLRDIVLIVVVAFVIAEFRIRTVMRSFDDASFVDQFARRLSVYMDAAVRNPEGFAEFLASIRAADASRTSDSDERLV
jgi:hypothetical protein